MSLDVAAVPFLTLLALGIFALMISVLLRSLVDRKIQLAQRQHDSLQAAERTLSAEPFWLRYGEPVKRSIQSLALLLVGLGFLNLISYGLGELADYLNSLRDGSYPARLSDDVRRLGVWIRQGADILLKIVVVAIGGVWTARFLHGAMRGLLNGGMASRALLTNARSKVRAETLTTTSSYVVNALVLVICLLMSLQILGLSVAPILATAGVASVAIGFGAQSLVRDLLAGFFILFEDQFAVGDVITIDSRSGTVETLTLRCTKLRLSDGSLLVIPNGEIKRIENATSGFSQVDYRVSVAYGEQVERAMQILGEQVLAIAREYPHEVISSPELLGVDSLKESSVVLRAKIKTKPGRQYAIERDLNQRVLKYFLEGQILLPAGK
ncbi:MAG: hypothetical protein RLZZ488_2416 [Pseudomonadota bacterium]|jgi:small conductance mechanosensitive channel